MTFKTILEAFLAEHPNVPQRRWALRQVTECMVQSLTPVTGVKRGYDDRGLKLRDWFADGDVVPCSGGTTNALLDTRFEVDLDEVFQALLALCPDLLPADASQEWARPSPFSQF